MKESVSVPIVTRSLPCTLFVQQIILINYNKKIIHKILYLDKEGNWPSYVYIRSGNGEKYKLCTYEHLSNIFLLKWKS